MATFSQRQHLKPLEKHLQLDGMDQELRAGLWNVLKISVWDLWSPPLDGYSMGRRLPHAYKVDELLGRIWIFLFKMPVDEMPDFDPDERVSAYRVLRSIVLDDKWNEVYDLVEFIVRNFDSEAAESLAAAFNHVLAAENAGYRFINRELAPISNATEVKAIETAIEKSTREIQEHLSRSLSLLSDRKAPDYRNSIKEAISAVEAACQAVAKKPGASLGDCLKQIKSVRPVHPALEQGLLKLYGYTSDAGGIRHALTDESYAPTHADARFMLVLCSAFTNYLWTVVAETGLTVL